METFFGRTFIKIFWKSIIPQRAVSEMLVGRSASSIGYLPLFLNKSLSERNLGEGIQIRFESLLPAFIGMIFSSQFFFSIHGSRLKIKYISGKKKKQTQLFLSDANQKRMYIEFGDIMQEPETTSTKRHPGKWVQKITIAYNTHQCASC